MITIIRPEHTVLDGELVHVNCVKHYPIGRLEIGIDRRYWEKEKEKFLRVLPSGRPIKLVSQRDHFTYIWEIDKNYKANWVFTETEVNLALWEK